MYIQEFNFTIVHCKGTDNVVADVLSRHPLKEGCISEPDEGANVQVCLLEISPDYKLLKKNFKQLRGDQVADDYFGRKIRFIEAQETEVKVWSAKEYRDLRWYMVYEGILFRRGGKDNPGFKLCVPRSQRIELMRVQHEEIGHFGKEKTHNQLKRRFYWPKMLKHVRQFVASCDLCQRSKVAKTSKGLMSPVVVEKPGQLVCLDLMGPLPVSRGGVTMLLVIVDAFSKFVKLYALKKATTKAILNRLTKNYIPEVQKPTCILSDNGTQFTARLWDQTLESLNIKVKRISVYFPQGNMTERYNKEVGRILRSYCHEQHTKWAGMLGFIEKCLNNVISDTTGYTATLLQTGKSNPSGIEKLLKFPEDEEGNDAPTLEEFWSLAHDKLLTKAARRAAKANRGIRPVTFAAGDPVLVRVHAQSSAEQRTIKKFFLIYQGPFYVLRQAGPNSYVIGDEEGNEVAKHNVINLKHYRVPLVNAEDLA